MPKQFLKTDKNFTDSILILNKLKIRYWVCHGTLLGIMRDKKLIPWDNDIDLGIWKKNLKKNLILKCFKDKKFQIKKKFFDNDNIITFRRLGGRDVDLNIYELTHDKRYAFQRHYAHSNVLMRLIYVLSVSGSYKGRHNRIINKFRFSRNFFIKLKKFLIKNKIFYKQAGFKTSAELFINVKKYYFKGLMINIPSNYKEYFFQIYGPSWIKPQKKYNWEKNPNSTFIN
tara:strand:- start:1021 stop:1704 length:684 start_codon:yes stop_codon:yes gene_type:complete